MVDATTEGTDNCMEVRAEALKLPGHLKTNLAKVRFHCTATQRWYWGRGRAVQLGSQQGRRWALTVQGLHGLEPHRRLLLDKVLPLQVDVDF